MHFILLFVTTSKYFIFFFNCSITTTITSFSMVCDKMHHKNPMMVHGRMNFLWLLLLLQSCYFKWSINGTISVFMNFDFIAYFLEPGQIVMEQLKKNVKYCGVVINNKIQFNFGLDLINCYCFRHVWNNLFFFSIHNHSNFPSFCVSCI